MEENTNNNQQVEEVEEVFPWDIKHPFVREAKQPVVKVACQQITGVNSKTWFELEKKGILSGNETYESSIQKIIKYYQQRQELAIEKARLEAEKAAAEPKQKKIVWDTESGLSPVQEAEIIQKIRVNKARERQLHLANMAASRDMLARQALIDLTTPMLGNISNILKQVAEEQPEMQPTIDKCFDSLYKMGTSLLEQCKEDEDSYIDLLSTEPVDINQMLDKGANVY